MTTKNLPINFKLRGIKTDQFAIIENAFNAQEQSGLVTSYNFGVDFTAKIISVKAKFSFEQNSVPFLIIEVSCHFEIDENSWNTLIDEQQELSIPKGLAAHLAMFTVGTTRGVLHTKVENTPFNQFMIPPIDLTAVFKDDIIVLNAQVS